MDAGLALAMALLGLASGVHCLGMCGGIVAAFSTQKIQLKDRPEYARQLAFNAGRLTSYALAGGLAGALGGTLFHALGAQSALYVVANLVLILAGLHLSGAAGWLALSERLGAPLWRRLQPLAARFSIGRSLPQAYAAGMLWGWIPCGLVYGALVAAAFAGGAAAGASAMAAFGLGTLPWLLVAGLAAARVRRAMNRRAVRLAAGGAVLAFGVFGLAQAGTAAESIRGFLCL